MNARATLLAIIGNYIRDQGWTQGEAARIFGLTQPRMSDLLNGKVDKFSLDALVNLLPVIGMTFDIRPLETLD